jgi:hypothetical protein
MKTKRNSSSSSRGAFAQEKRELRQFWLRTTEALARVAVFGLFAGLHRGLSYFVGDVAPHEWASVTTFVEAILSLMFTVLYLTLAWDTLSVFLPWMRKRPTQSSSDKTTEESSSSSS